MSVTYIESLSPYDIHTLSQTARQQLSLLIGSPDHDLRRIIGHARLLDILVVEINRIFQDMANDVPRPTLISMLREINHIGIFRRAAITSVAGTGGKDAPRCEDSKRVKVLCPVSPAFQCRRSSSIGASLERYKDMSDETQRLLHVYRCIVGLSPVDEHEEEIDSDSSSNSDLLDSDEEDWD